LKDLPEEYRKDIVLGDTMIDTVSVPECPTGTKGRSAIFEMFRVDKEMQNAILKTPTDAELYKVARSKGMLTMREDAMLKAVAGIIPFTEVYGFSNETE